MTTVHTILGNKWLWLVDINVYRCYNYTMEKQILRPDGTVYVTVAVTEDMLEFRNFTKKGMTVKMDAKILEQIVPFLNEALFWQKAGHD